MLTVHPTKTDQITLKPIQKIAGEVHLVGSKSISNRALLLASLADNQTQLTNLLVSDDVRYMLQALKELGVQYYLSEDQTVCHLQGTNGFKSISLISSLYLGNAGTAMRPLTAILALKSTEKEPIILTGDPRMKERPILHLVEALKMGKAQIDYLEQVGYPPLAIKGGFEGGKISVKGSISSQFLTALLIAAPLANCPTEINVIGELVSKPYINMTLQMMAQFKVHVEHQDFKHFMIQGQQTYHSPKQYLIEGDASSASYFLAAAAIKGKVRVYGLTQNSLQGDIAFAAVLEKMGAKITWEKDYVECEHRSLQAVDLDLNAMPDAAMTIAIVALFAQGTSTIRNIFNWRVKETDRLSAMANELRKVGAMVVEGEDFIQITPPKRFLKAEIETYQDHRMAMCFSLIALSGVSVTILDPNCTAKTFPDYFEVFTKIAHF